MTLDGAWFGLPGPRAMLDRVFDDLNEGRSVVLALPSTVVGDWSTILRTASPHIVWEAEREWFLTTVDPAMSLAAEFLPEMPDGPFSAVRSLTDSEWFRGLRFMIAPCSPQAWPAWRAFLWQWATAMHSVPFTRRTAFCVIVMGVPPADLPLSEAGLSVRCWHNAARDADLGLYASSRFTDAPYPPLERRIAAAVAARLAQWDPRVVDWLREEPLEAILNPQRALLTLAQDWGWSSRILREQGPQWARGHVDRCDGRSCIHAAASALLGDEAALIRLVWSGQLSVLLPFVEERRWDYIAALRHSFRLPHRLSDGTAIDAPEELEINHIAHQVRVHRLPLSDVLADALGPLAEIRNRLAHLKCVPIALLRDPAIQRLADDGWAPAEFSVHYVDLPAA